MKRAQAVKQANIQDLIKIMNRKEGNSSQDEPRPDTIAVSSEQPDSPQPMLVKYEKTGAWTVRGVRFWKMIFCLLTWITAAHPTGLCLCYNSAGHPHHHNFQLLE
ncbi:hypothetical protein Pcinc_031476 [Petrolisthes cinctipes]|uniref:Uncharacterized protein n=1 Tax=Petrolisthes cinctipes TaxID=88211 RepID=A0AAE1EWL5_PETCI|nr:hypothetical protein Pcinc_031476 [Petrolisthes cinctipes]